MAIQTSLYLYENQIFVQISLPSDQERNQTEMTIQEVQETYPYLNWMDYISNMLPDGVITDENEIINVAVPSFFEAFGELLAQTPKKTIANYLFWRVIQSTAYYMNEQMSSRRLEYLWHLSRQKEVPAWWIYCTKTTNEK